VHVFMCLAQPPNTYHKTGMCRVRPLGPYPSLLTIALRHRNRLDICINKGNYRKVSCGKNTTRKELHPIELTGKVTRICLSGTSRGLHKERCCRIDVSNELKCM